MRASRSQDGAATAAGGPELRGKPIVFFARLSRHIFSRLEFFARYDIQIAQNPLGLGLEHRLDFLAYAPCDTRGVVHQPGNFVKESVGGLGHCFLRVSIV